MNPRRVFNFQLVALGGTVVNMGMLWLLRGLLHLPILVAGGCAIELAIIHNFTWHYFRTWRERVRFQVRDYVIRLVQYNAVTASIDFLVNLTVLWALTKYVGIHYLAANLIGMLGGPIFKFLANEYLIFRKRIPFS